MQLNFINLNVICDDFLRNRPLRVQEIPTRCEPPWIFLFRPAPGGRGLLPQIRDTQPPARGLNKQGEENKQISGQTKQ